MVAPVTSVYSPLYLTVKMSYCKSTQNK